MAGQDTESAAGRSRTTVLVVDDHRTFSDLVALALEGEPDLHCVGTAHSVAAALAKAEALRPDIVLMDVRLGDEDGIAATARLTRSYPGIRVVVLTAHADRALMQRAAEAGACGLLPKDGLLTDLLRSLRVARAGGLVVHPTLLRLLVTADPAGESRIPPLTRRERQVLSMLADGIDTSSIAHRLQISVNTCRGHVKSLLMKLDAHSQLEAVAVGRKHGLLDDAHSSG